MGITDSNNYRLAIPSQGVHVAGPLERGRQHCARCGELLTDKPAGHPGFQEGAHVEVYGGDPVYKSVTSKRATCPVAATVTAGG